MMLNRSGIVVLGVLSLTVLACPAPQDNDNGAEEEEGGAGGSSTGSGGKGGTTAKGGSGGTPAAQGGKGGTPSGEGGTPAEGGKGGTPGEGGKGGTPGSGGGGGSSPPDMGTPDTGGGEGGAAGITFMAVYDGVIKPGCGCHTGANSPGGLRMQNAMAGYMALVGVDSACAGQKRVLAGDPTKSVLSLIVKGGVAGCASRGNKMPKGQAALSAAKIKMIDDWIMGGAKM
jgi:hypothetical protein